MPPARPAPRTFSCGSQVAGRRRTGELGGAGLALAPTAKHAGEVGGDGRDHRDQHEEREGGAEAEDDGDGALADEPARVPMVRQNPAP